MTDQGGTKTEKKPPRQSSVREEKTASSILFVKEGCFGSDSRVRWSLITLSGSDQHHSYRAEVLSSLSQRGLVWLLHYQPGNSWVT